ncbi:hypothetical protein [Kitasatospora griseola]|uniref:hypothetical protein n=1 Tax=Kitasatospora griseola TaxID=2064 RepID=UPI0037FEE279
MPTDAAALALHALLEHHRPAYHRYAAAVLTDEDLAHHTVQTALEDFTLHSGSILSTRNAAATVWSALEHRVREAAHATGRPTPDNDLHTLRHGLGLDTDQIAALTGTDPAHTHSCLRALA